MKSSILLIDDNAISLKLVGEILEMEGFSVSRCADAESALIAISQSIPDLILMDIGLPGMNGLELTQKLKAEEATKFIKIIALTAFAMSDDRDKIMASGCDGYITKPIDIRKFTEQVKTYLR